MNKCLICNNEFKPLSYYVKDLTPVCSLLCLLSYIQQLPDKKPRQYTRNPVFKYFQSQLEEEVYNYLSKHLLTFYEPYILELNDTIYIPDLYIPSKDLFIELKGGKWRLRKVLLTKQAGYDIIVFSHVYDRRAE